MRLSFFIRRFSGVRQSLGRLDEATRLHLPVIQKLIPKRVKACVLDWSGTTVDAFVIAPAIVFYEVFKLFGIEITMEEARLPMGLRKDLHIKQITEMARVRARWIEVYGKEPDQTDVDNMFAKFVPMQLAVLPQYSTLLPGVAEVTQRLQADGIKLGTSTGFTRDMVDVLLKDAIRQGYCPDVTVAGDEVVHGARPKPHMVFRNMDLLDIDNPRAVVKVDDTVTGVQEGVNGGCWSVGVGDFSNYININSLKEYEDLSSNYPEELERRRQLSLKNSNKVALIMLYEI